MHNSKKSNYVIVGGGIVGLATADALLSKSPNARIVVIEKNASPGQHQTGRNSGVIHAGVYYKPGSLKAKLCKAGVVKTIDFCEQENIAYEQCGKLIVATDDSEIDRLDALENRARQNQLKPRRIESDELYELEPNITGVSALLVKQTAIVDYAAICRSLADRLSRKGVKFHFETELLDLVETTDEITAKTTKGDFQADVVIACAGLQSDIVAGMVGLADDFRIIPFRGEYFRLPETYNDISKHLIYPVPDPAYPFLGVHLTKMIGGYVTVGPNAMLSFGKESYNGNYPIAQDLWRTMKFPGFWKLMAQNIRSGIHEARGSFFKSVYLERCRKYCPSLELSDLQPHPVGIRAQAVNIKGQMIEDFLVKQTKRSVHVCNAPSPAATSAFPIAEDIAEKVIAQLT